VTRQALHVLCACTVIVSATLAGAVHAADKHVAQWPKVAPAPAALPVEPEYVPQWPLVAAAPAPWLFSPFRLEAGARYWFSSSTMNFAFSNGDPLFGDPTSTLDWKGTTAHAGEAFARIDHKPTGLFVKGLVGGGGIATNGEMIDRDFLFDQIKFSDTTSDVKQNSLFYASGDIGMFYDIPEAGMRFGGFVGYQFWREKATAYGVRCQPDDVRGQFCGPPATIVVPFTVPATIYEPTWHALRIGVEGRMKISPHLSISGEIAGIPYATLSNKDSHLLRTDLGAVPNIISTAKSGYGLQGELFVNYALNKNWEVGAGLRYWGLVASPGTVQFGPDFGIDFELTKFEQQRYGVLLQVKGKL
jgi:hypothetical protein